MVKTSAAGRSSASSPAASPAKSKVSVFSLLRQYWQYSSILVVFTVGANMVSLLIPKLIASSIDTFSQTGAFPGSMLTWFGLAIGVIFICTFVQNLMQTVASEKIARDMRHDLAAKISRQTNGAIEEFTPAVLLTNLTSDIDAIKMFVAQAVATLISSVLLIIGASVLLLVTDWQLALVVLLLIPIIGVTFGTIFGKVRKLFVSGQEILDRLNNVINESILGAALIRILHSEDQENEHFAKANRAATAVGMQILGYFASLIPIITFVASMAVLAIVVLGGHYVITDRMTIGNFTAFTTYVGILIFPIIMIGFISNVIARATASYERILKILQSPDPVEEGTLTAENLQGVIEVKDVSLKIGNKTILKHASFSIPAGARTALIGPTAAGKTQLMSLLVGLTVPTTGSITYDGQPLSKYSRTSLFRRVGLVFQQSVVFRMSLRENIAFSADISDADLQKAIAAAELSEFIAAQPKQLETPVSERGTTLSGGQKQRLMLARALALNPVILLLDDFTARVDLKTEQTILKNVRRSYPDVTLISITQKLRSVEDYDQILVLMEGELIAKGTHAELLKSSPEYIQMYESQKSTNHYEVSAE